jgi:hypothetical protein
MRSRRPRPPGFGSPTETDITIQERDERSDTSTANVQGSPKPALPPVLPIPDAALPDLHDARTRPVFIRAPDPLARWLELTLVGLREHRPKATRQDIICALMLRYVRNHPAQAEHLIELLDDLEQARRRR